MGACVLTLALAAFLVSADARVTDPVRRRGRPHLMPNNRWHKPLLTRLVFRNVGACVLTLALAAFLVSADARVINPVSKSVTPG